MVNLPLKQSVREVLALLYLVDITQRNDVHTNSDEFLLIKYNISKKWELVNQPWYCLGGQTALYACTSLSLFHSSKTPFFIRLSPVLSPLASYIWNILFNRLATYLFVWFTVFVFLWSGAPFSKVESTQIIFPGGKLTPHLLNIPGCNLIH